MKKWYLILIVVLFSFVFISAQQELKPALVVIKVKFQSVKDLSAFKDEIQKIADKYKIIVEDVNFKSLK